MVIGDRFWVIGLNPSPIAYSPSPVNHINLLILIFRRRPIAIMMVMINEPP